MYVIEKAFFITFARADYKGMEKKVSPFITLW